VALSQNMDKASNSTAVHDAKFQLQTETVKDMINNIGNEHYAKQF